MWYQETGFRKIKGWWFLFTERFDVLLLSLLQDFELNVFSTGIKHLFFTILNTGKVNNIS